MPPFLRFSIIRYGSRVSGASEGKEQRPSLHQLKKQPSGCPRQQLANLLINIKIILIHFFYSGLALKDVWSSQEHRYCNVLSCVFDKPRVDNAQM